MIIFRSVFFQGNSVSKALFGYCKTKLSLYNKAPMRHFRLIAGFLTLSLALGGAVSDILHIQERSEAQTSAHLMAHADSADVVAIDSLNSDLDGEGCYENSPQVAITSPSGQRTSLTEAIGIAPHLFAKIAPHQTETFRTFKGRSPPLFEHASLFAATVSMRI